MDMGNTGGSECELLDSLFRSEGHGPLYSDFFVEAMKSYVFFDKMPAGFKKDVVSHVYNIFSYDAMKSEDVVDMLVANEAYRLLSSKKKGKKKGSDDVVSFLQSAAECRTFDSILDLVNEKKADLNGGLDKPMTFKDGTTFADKMTELFASMLENYDVGSNGVLNNYMGVCESVLGDSTKYKLIDAFVDSVGKRSDNDVIVTSRALRDYLVDWDAISTAVDYMEEQFGVNLTENLALGGDKNEHKAKQHFRDAVVDRILSELKWGNSDGLSFWNAKMKCNLPKSLVNAQGYYGVAVSKS
ncbi:MAG: hypothetical protein KAS11_02370 [Candidatus Aenigmarchaeota archaeon]|nr:hypothetical protein [Candidatus Aenigmarchaeota archaeon]